MVKSLNITHTKQIMYSNDIEYRQYFRKITGMRDHVFYHEPGHINLNEEIPECMDEITLDEYMYDEESVSNALANIYKATKDNVRFQSLYDLAAAQMISMDREIGLTVLMTYDYLWLFMACVDAHIEGREFDEPYNQLIHVLQPQKRGT